MFQPSNESQGNFPEKYLGYPTAFEADRDRQFRKFDRIIQLAGFDDILATPEDRVKYIDKLTPTGFEQLLEFTNGIQTNLPKSYRGYSDNMQIITDESRKIIDVMPAPKHKQELMGAVLGYVQQADSLEDKAFLLAMGITTVHPFSEGNGRLARGIYYLLTEGYRPNDPKLRQVLGEDGENIITPDVNAIRPLIMGKIKIDLETHVYDPTSNTAVPRLVLGVGIDDYDPVSMLPEGLDYRMGVDVAGMLKQEDLREMLPFLLAKHHGSPAAHAAIRSPKDNPDVFFFILNEFWQNMTAEDLESLQSIGQDLKYLYTIKAMEELSLGYKSLPMLILDDSGEYVQMPVAIAMKQIINGQLDVSVEATAERLARRRSRETATQSPKLTRQARRKLEHKARRAAHRNLGT